ncbi:MAG: hypothetical protein HOV81_38235 [Kofleriaceae bacterium]|nr:hypothetical protein [Kofleriaceae bacterium]
MRRLVFGVLAVGAFACAGNMATDPYAPRSGGTIDQRAGSVPDVRCAGTPAVGPKRGFRSWRSGMITAIARADHRGYDLVATQSEPQVLRGTLAYGLTDKSLEHEDVDLFTCVAGAWQLAGTARTDDNGDFALRLEGAQRMPIGLRDVYGSVVGDRTGFRCLAYVAPAGSQLVVSDVDGTLTANENQFAKAVFLGRRVGAQPGAAEALSRATAAGYQVVYVTARGERFTDATRHWLATHGFPRGPVRLAPTLVLRPGAPTVAYKKRVIGELAADFAIAGIGNRSSDITAYRAAGLAPERIFIKLPEYAGEVATSLRQGAAIGFGHYSALFAK